MTNPYTKIIADASKSKNVIDFNKDGRPIVNTNTKDVIPKGKNYQLFVIRDDTCTISDSDCSTLLVRSGELPNLIDEEIFILFDSRNTSEALSKIIGRHRTAVKTNRGIIYKNDGREAIVYALNNTNTKIAEQIMGYVRNRIENYPQSHNVNASVLQFKEYTLSNFVI